MSKTLLQQFEEKQMAQAKHAIPDFRPGDTVLVKTREGSGAKERIQSFEGVCIAFRGSGFRKSFTLRKIAVNGEGVERVMLLYSPLIESIAVIKRGRVRRAKLYYLRQRSGKSARIVERKVTKDMGSGT